jgi:hypothetical protein
MIFGPKKGRAANCNVYDDEFNNFHVGAGRLHLQPHTEDGSNRFIQNSLFPHCAITHETGSVSLLIHRGNLKSVVL